MKRSTHCNDQRLKSWIFIDPTVWVEGKRKSLETLCLKLGFAYQSSHAALLMSQSRVTFNNCPIKVVLMASKKIVTRKRKVYANRINSFSFYHKNYYFFSIPLLSSNTLRVWFCRFCSLSLLSRTNLYSSNSCFENWIEYTTMVHRKTQETFEALRPQQHSQALSPTHRGCQFK